MYLKRLELLGFKSFPEKTVIRFTPGVTSIVGPNGCGKSNVLDSMRWVLGEQKVSLLRGTKMEEIIFNGTRDMKPLGMAEVTLVIQNNKGRLPTEYGEVQLTRRLFRSGESEYLLNKIPCRLKDITDLLMDTGAGAHVYSMIQQDMVDAILSDRTDDRRFLFEEAAGISKYKSRKKAALRKLEATEQDLLRLQDIVTEVTSQVNSLKRQVRKAERHRELTEELKAWELYLSQSAIGKLNQERLEKRTEVDKLTSELIRHETSMDSLAALQEQDRKNLTDLDRELADLSERVYQKSESAHALEKEISILGEKKSNARILREKNTQEISALTGRRQNLGEQIAQTEESLSVLDKDLLSLETQVGEKMTASVEADNKVLAARQERDKANERLMDIESRLSAERSDDTNIKAQEDENTARLQEIAVQLEILGGKLKNLRGLLGSRQDDVRRLKEKGLARQNERVNLENEILQGNQTQEDISGRILELTAALEAAEARHKLLSEMMAHYEGFGAGVIAAISSREQWPNLIGTVADQLTPDRGFETAIEAALGEAAGYLICRDRQSATDIISYLKKERKGRAGILILDDAADFAEITRPDIADEGFLGWADTRIKYPEGMKTIAHLLLAPIAVVTPEAAERILPMLPPYFSLVTPEGEVRHSRAVLTGGSTDEISLLGRKEKISEQETNIKALRSELDHFREERNHQTGLLGQKQALLKSLAEEIASIFEETSAAEKELTAAGFEIQSAEQEVTRLETEKKRVSEKLDSLRVRQLDLNLSQDQLLKKKEELAAGLAVCDESIRLLETAAEEQQKALSRLQIAQVEQKSQHQQLESRIRHIRELIDDIERNSETKSREIVNAETDAERAAERIIVLEGELRKLFEERTALTEQQILCRENRDTLQAKLDEREKDIKSARQAREEISRNLHVIDIRLTEIEGEVKNIESRIREEYELELSQVATAIPDPSVPEESRRQRMQELKEQVRNLGAVNLLALDEYRTADERQNFLSTQLNDLLQARSTLQSTIVKINSTAKKLFQETFDQVRINFQRVFEELFAGGESDVKLINPDDPLESPIEIIARPRGKKLLSIAQMSGGERALTAIALLFAIYLAKPSPFCVLDEIDAPLDDANIHRFLRLIKAFSDQTQFIIITHNKITMEAADVLYGVTMEKPGVSKVVSVRFNEDESGQVTDTDAAAILSGDQMSVPDRIIERLRATAAIPLDPVEDSENN